MKYTLLAFGIIGLTFAISSCIPSLPEIPELPNIPEIPEVPNIQAPSLDSVSPNIDLPSSAKPSDISTDSNVF